MKIGDSVRFVNQSGKGIIKKIQSPKVWVENEYGFLEEWTMSDIVMDEEVLIEIALPQFIEDFEEQIPKETKSKNKTEEIVVDLHIGHLVDYPNRYSSHQKLKIQLETAKKSIEKYRKNTEKLILIHGKGKGTLKTELYKILNSTQKISFFDANIQRYKMGAVEIRFLD